MTTIRDGDAHALLQTHCESTEQDAHREELRDFLTQIKWVWNDNPSLELSQNLPSRAHHLWLPLAIELQFDGADGDDHTRIAPPAALVIAAACGAIVMAPDCCRMTLAFKFIFHALRLIDRIHPDDDGRISQILARQVCAMRAQSPKSFAVMLTRFPGMERRLEALTDTDVHMGDALHTTDTNPSLADQDMGHQQATTADEVTPPYTTPPSTQAAINSGEVLPQHIPISDTRLPSTAQSFGLPTPPSSQPAGASSSAAQSSDAPYKPVGRLRRDTAKAVSSTIHHEKRPRSPTEPSSPRNEPKKKTVFQKAT